MERDRDYDDYIYDAQKLMSLSGKKYHKKKNHLNAFKKEYEGRYEFRLLDCADRQEILDFLNQWISEKGDMEENRRVNREQAMEMKASLEQIQSHLLAVKDELPLMKEELTNAKGELSEKVHTENVKCYRNLQDLFKTIDAKIDHLDIVTDKIKRVKTSVTVAILLGLINLVAMAGLYLLQLGIISF